MTEALPSGARAWWPGVAAAMLGIIVYLPSLQNGFVYDDTYNIVQNPWIKSWANWHACLTEMRANAADYHLYPCWRPLRLFSWMVDYSIAGLNPAWWHFVNLLWHGAGILGLFALARRMGLQPLGAFAAAAIFALHPVQSEAVLWIKERDGLMSTALLLWAVVAGLGKGWGSAAAAAGLLCLSLLSKETGVVFVPIAAAAAWVLYSTGRDRSLLRRDLVVGVAGVALTIAYLAVRARIMGGTAQVAAHMGGTLGMTLWTMLGVFARYLGLVVAPIHLPLVMSDIEPRGAADGLAWLGLALLLACVGFGWCLRHRAPIVTVGILWFLVCLAPVSNLVPMLQWMAVRFLYPALAGVALAAGYGVDRFGAAAVARGWSLAGRFRADVLVLAALLVAGAELSFLRNAAWRTDQTLWTDAYLTNPRAIETIRNYASAALVAGRPAEALQVIDGWPFEENPGKSDLAWQIHVIALERLGRRQEALDAAGIGVSRYPKSLEMLRTYALVHGRAGNAAEAERAFRHIIAADPTYLPALDSFAEELARQGRAAEAEAVRADAKALRARPRSEWDAGRRG